tara:strand:- start:408 stop:803 length:396 start_codon:yes stop_codon:yes gene_type:complete
MSLRTAMQQVMRPAIPELVLSACEEDDKVLFENVLHLALEIFPAINISLATNAKTDKSYKLSVPFSTDLQTVSLSDMQELQNYSPARISEVVVESKTANPICLSITILCSGARLICTQYDVIRIKKRKHMQ